MDAFHKGKLVERVDEPNLVVADSVLITALLLGGSSSASPITGVGFGTNSAPASVGNIALTDAFVTGITSANVIFGTVTFSFELLASQANGITIWEYGLLSGSLLFARKVRSSGIAKTSAWSFSGAWSITFSAG